MRKLYDQFIFLITISYALGRIGLKTLIVLSLIISLPTYIEAEQSTQPIDEVGVEQKLGDYVPSDLNFLDENGQTVTLKELIKKPTILSLVYFRCGGICNPLLNNLAVVLDRLALQPGQDYDVLTISFDAKDSFSVAEHKKKGYLQSLEKPFPQEAWKFLTGNEENIGKLVKAVGFKFKRIGEEFIHPALLIVFAPDGKITRYLFGNIFSPFDLKMALIEASEGKVGSRMSKALLYCYNYDPKGRRYVFNTLKISGIIILLLLIAFFIYLSVSKRSTNSGQHNTES